MTFYLSIFFCICILLFIEESLPKVQKKYVDILMLIILAAASGFRGLGGSDYDIYAYAYDSVPSLSYFFQHTEQTIVEMQAFGMETGYLFFISFIKTCLALSFYGYLVLQAAIIYSLMYVGLRRYTNHWGLFMLIFIYKMFLYETFVSMRQPLTIVLFYCILPYIYDRKIWKYYLILFFFVIPLHNGALLLLLVYFTSFFKITRKRIILLNCIFIPTLLVSEMGIDPLASLSVLFEEFSSDSIVGTKAEIYKNSIEELSIFHTLEYLLIMFLMLLNYDKIVQSDKYAPFVIKLFLVLLPIMTLFRTSIIFRRELDYFIPTYAFILGYLCDIYRNSFRYIIIITTTCICFFGYTRFLILFGNGALIPYVSWLDVPNAFFFLMIQ